MTNETEKEDTQKPQEAQADEEPKIEEVEEPKKVVTKCSLQFKIDPTIPYFPEVANVASKA